MKNYCSYIFFVLFLAVYDISFSQNIHLKFIVENSSEKQVINNLNFEKAYASPATALKALDSISEKLSQLGFINHEFNTEQKKDTILVNLKLNAQIQTLLLTYHNKDIPDKALPAIITKIDSSSFEVPFKKATELLHHLTIFFENSGYSFTNLKLTNLKMKDSILEANIIVEQKDKRFIDDVIVQGYSQFPKKFIKHYLNISERSVFSKSKLVAIENKLAQLSFISTIRKPEILFTKDSTILYLYVSKKQINLFDGLLGFNNTERNKSLQLNGYLNLELNNSFNTGESIKINWQSTNKKSNALNIQFNLPYIFNTPIQLSGNFSIFKQDTLFTSTTANFGISYLFQNNTNLKLIYESESATTLKNNAANTIFSDFSKSLFGAAFTYSENGFFNSSQQQKFYIEAQYLFGNRKITNNNTNQSKIRLQGSASILLSDKSSFFLKSTGELLLTKNPLENELFRIGGTQSLRGFDEISLLTQKYNVVNLEYRYKTGSESYFYTISDYGLLLDYALEKTNNLFALGVGYQLATNSSILNIAYALGKFENTPFAFKNSKVHISITYPF